MSNSISSKAIWRRRPLWGIGLLLLSGIILGWFIHGPIMEVIHGDRHRLADSQIIFQGYRAVITEEIGEGGNVVIQHQLKVMDARWGRIYFERNLKDRYVQLCVVGSRVYALGFYQVLFAFDTQTKQGWSHTEPAPDWVKADVVQMHAVYGQHIFQDSSAEDVLQNKPEGPLNP